MEEGLKVRLQSFQQLKSQASAAERKKTASLLVSDLNEIVSKANDKKCTDDERYQQLSKQLRLVRRGAGGGGGEVKGDDDEAAAIEQHLAARRGEVCYGADAFVDSENLVSCLVVLPRSSEAEWLRRYETLASEEVPYGEVCGQARSCTYYI